MRLLLHKYKIVILSVLLMTGIYITGWAFVVHFDKKAKGAESQKELKNNNQAANIIPSVLDRNNILLVLVCIGLVGFFGVRRPCFVKRQELDNSQNNHYKNKLSEFYTNIETDKSCKEMLLRESKLG